MEWTSLNLLPGCSLEFLSREHDYAVSADRDRLLLELERPRRPERHTGKVRPHRCAVAAKCGAVPERWCALTHSALGRVWQHSQASLAQFGATLPGWLLGEFSVEVCAPSCLERLLNTYRQVTWPTAKRQPDQSNPQQSPRALQIQFAAHLCGCVQVMPVDKSFYPQTLAPGVRKATSSAADR